MTKDERNNQSALHTVQYRSESMVRRNQPYALLQQEDKDEA